MDFLAQHDERPFFLWYSIPDPHIPFQTCEPYASMYQLEAIDVPPSMPEEMKRKPRAQQIDHAVMQGDAVDDDTIRRVISLYYGMNTSIQRWGGFSTGWRKWDSTRRPWSSTCLTMESTWGSTA